MVFFIQLMKPSNDCELKNSAEINDFLFQFYFRALLHILKMVNALQMQMTKTKI